MTNHQVPRRRFLRQMLAVVPAASAATGAALTQTACGNSPSAPAVGEDLHPYQPASFNADEWRFVRAAVARLIPGDRSNPGALEAGVPEFIDRQMDTPYGHGKLWYMEGPFHPDQPAELGFQMRLSPRDIYRYGIQDCDGHCRREYGGKPFADLAPVDQDAALGQMERGEREFETVPSATFFALLLANTREGFFADPIYGGNKDMAGWKMIGFPGARADFMDWADRPGVAYPYGPVSIDGKRG